MVWFVHTPTEITYLIICTLMYSVLFCQFPWQLYSFLIGQKKSDRVGAVLNKGCHAGRSQKNIKMSKVKKKKAHNVQTEINQNERDSSET